MVRFDNATLRPSFESEGSKGVCKGKGSKEDVRVDERCISICGSRLLGDGERR